MFYRWENNWKLAWGQYVLAWAWQNKLNKEIVGILVLIFVISYLNSVINTEFTVNLCYSLFTLIPTLCDCRWHHCHKDFCASTSTSSMHVLPLQKENCVGTYSSSTDMLPRQKENFCGHIKLLHRYAASKKRH